MLLNIKYDNRTDYFRAVFLFVVPELVEGALGGIMIAVLKSGVTHEQIDNLIEWFKSQGLKVHLSEGDYKTILGLIGDTTKIDIDLLKGLDIIESVTRISEPFKKANRKFHPEDTIVDVSGVNIETAYEILLQALSLSHTDGVTQSVDITLQTRSWSLAAT